MFGVFRATTVALVLLALAGCTDRRADELMIRGSDSEVNLVQTIAERFMQTHPEADITVAGGGSGVGIATLLDGTTDLASSSRALKPHEHLLALRKGVDPVATLFATDALCVIVHIENPVEAFSLDDLGLIYRGEVTTWDGFDHTGAIVTYGRQSSSGTASFFRSAAVRGDYTSSMRAMSGSAQIVESIRRDPGGIGYVAVGYVQHGMEGIRAVPLRGPDGEPVDPLDEPAVMAGRYPLARPLYQFSDGEPTGVMLEFLRFEVGAEGVAIGKELGFYPLTTEWAAQNAHLGTAP